jgi:alkanesulfonate monooxygenase SsuD/methylene tetrahydromethanopterin reductase-like flavin-dependent oxidoreductase (luciferase family)
MRQALADDGSGLDYIAVQDHPCQRRFFDTWTFLSYVAGRTESIRLLTDLFNLPLRLPRVLAKSAASIDVLSGGRVEIGIGAGGFRHAIVVMGGPRRSPRESVDALEEAIGIIRASGTALPRSDATGCTVAWSAPAQVRRRRIASACGSARTVRGCFDTRRRGDVWLPSLNGNFVQPQDVPSMHPAIDDAARAARRARPRSGARST